jgi:hypothetical protein
MATTVVAPGSSQSQGSPLEFRVITQKLSRLVSIQVISTVLFFLTGMSSAFARETRMTARTLSAEQVERLSVYMGVYDETKTYVKRVDGHGTGLIPPSAERWPDILGRARVMADLQTGTLTLPVRHDNSSLKWFPPIGDQGGENSCTVWATVYYGKTFQEGMEHNWDLSGCEWDESNAQPDPAYHNYIFSPDFVYHQINRGIDGGSAIDDAIGLLDGVGCCTWAKMPSSQEDFLSWPSEAAWRQAPLYRSGSEKNYFDLYADNGMEDFKKFLSEKNLACINVKAGHFSELSDQDLWTLDNYDTWERDHVTTIVGYDDEFGPYTEEGAETYGAFKVANSWGIGGWENIDDGCFYISYACMKQFFSWPAFYENYNNYRPALISVFEISHDSREQCEITLGVGELYTPVVSKGFGYWDKRGAYPFPPNVMVLDITEFLPFLSESNTLFLSLRDRQIGIAGIIESFAAEQYEDYLSNVLLKKTVCLETPMAIRDNKTVVARIYDFDDAVPVELTSFSGNVAKNKVHLEWTTASETGNFGFDVERRSMDSDFEKIGFVPGRGTTSQSHVYAFVDDSPKTPGDYTYRLKQIDLDGSVAYSNTVTIALLAPKDFAIFNPYPNPFNAGVMISYEIPATSEVHLEIFNLLGRRVKTLVEGEQKAGRYEIRWTGQGEAGELLPSDIYVILIQAGNHAAARKVLMIK